MVRKPKAFEENSPKAKWLKFLVVLLKFDKMLSLCPLRFLVFSNDHNVDLNILSFLTISLRIYQYACISPVSIFRKVIKII